jgi:hypothetical protein
MTETGVSGETKEAKDTTDSTKLLPNNYTAPYGSPEALENLGTSAAPLLAGFAFALIGLLLDKGSSMWKPDLALLLLVLAGVLLIGAVEFAFNARRYHVPPGDYVAFSEIAKADGYDVASLQASQVEWRKEHASWAGWARRAYNAGIIALFFAIAIVLVPHSGLGHMAPLRVAAVATPALAGTVELIWWVASG